MLLREVYLDLEKGAPLAFRRFPVQAPKGPAGLAKTEVPRWGKTKLSRPSPSWSAAAGSAQPTREVVVRNAEVNSCADAGPHVCAQRARAVSSKITKAAVKFVSVTPGGVFDGSEREARVGGGARRRRRALVAECARATARTRSLYAKMPPRSPCNNKKRRAPEEDTETVDGSNKE